MSEKKMVSRRFVISLGIGFIIMLAGLGGAMLYVTTTTITERDKRIDSLNTQLSNRDYQILQLNSNVTNLQNQVNNFTDIVNLGKSTVWISGKYENLWDGSPIYGSPIYEGDATYAGYIVVQVYTDWNNDTVEVTYSFQGLNFDDKIDFNATGITATFRILPSSNIKVFVFTKFSGVLSGPADSSTTITYYY
jgi:hypothetical protein